MSIDELKKEAEEYLNKDGTNAEKLMDNLGQLHITKKQFGVLVAVFMQCYIDSAEPREKIIAEKDIKIAELEKANENLVAQSMILIQRNAELEQENAELKEQNEQMKCCGNCWYFNIDKNIGTGNLFCDLMLIKKEYCKNKDHWKFKGDKRK